MDIYRLSAPFTLESCMVSGMIRTNIDMEASVRKMMIILLGVVLLLTTTGCGKKADPKPVPKATVSGVGR